MAKDTDPKTPAPLNPSLPRHTHKYLKQLTKTGVHGTKLAEVARTLIYDQIKYLLSKGVIRWEYAENDDEMEMAEPDE